MPDYLPVLSSEAGSCLTAKNWLEVGVKRVVYYFDELLFRPGFGLLNQIGDVSAYLGWKQSLVLNASRLVANKEGFFLLKSPYDGSLLQFSYSELFKLVSHINPLVFVFPPNTLVDYPEIWEHWPKTITPVIPEDDCTQNHKIYLGPELTWDKLLLQFKFHLPSSCYVAGAFDVWKMKKLRQLGVDFIESDEPARAAFHGIMYTNSHPVDLKEANKKLCFESIEPTCTCPTCAQGLTQAYLHHLLKNTPLLCQRFLIQHNILQTLGSFFSHNDPFSQ